MRDDIEGESEGLCSSSHTADGKGLFAYRLMGGFIKCFPRSLLRSCLTHLI